ncbi:MAG: sulfurtransferase TusA family protein [bacterium]|nr:sulfurtransferase TusA family protein [bacterium]
MDTTDSLDTVGLLCPIPVIRTAEKVRSMPPGSVLEILASDSGIEPDLRSWCKSHHHEFLECIKEGELFRVFLRVKGQK